MQRPKPADLADWPPSGRAWLLVAVLMGGYACAFVDRQILTLMVDPIRRDLHISDTQFSLLGGLAFMIFYIGLVMPLAWIADHFNRRALISIGVAFWSVMTAACGLATQFWPLFAARMGVGAGEATLSPAAYSMIADTFPPHRRTRAMAVYSAGALAGSGLALLIGGAAIQWALHAGPIRLPLVGLIHPWQCAFFIVSLPGLLILALLGLIREPVRRETTAAADRDRSSIRELLEGRAEAFFLITAGLALSGIAIASSITWAPTVLIRTYHWTAPQAGLALGLILLFGSTPGAVLGGLITDRLRAQGHQDATLRVIIVGVAVALPFAVLMPLAPTAPLAVTLLAVANVLFGLTNGLAAPTFAAMAPNHLRARLFGFYFVFANPVAFVVGPTGVAMISDQLLHNSQHIGLALTLLTALVMPASLVLFARALAPYRRCVEAASALAKSPITQPAPATAAAELAASWALPAAPAGSD